MKKTVLSLSLLATLQIQASLVAVMDSGTDMNHLRLKSKQWVNAREGLGNVDLDGDGLPGNKFGWDFTTNTSRFFNNKYVALYTGDVKTFFDFMGKYDLGTVSSQEINWLRIKSGDEKLMSVVNFMASYTHGTHVAGIASKDSDKIKILPIKVLGSDNEEVPTDENPTDPSTYTYEKFRDEVLEEARKEVLSHAKELTHLKFHKVDVANQSYGLSYTNAAQFIMGAYAEIFKKQMPRQLAIDLTNEFFKTMSDLSSQVSKANDYTLFVIAAGNDSMNNDQFGAFPTNYNVANKISVAASNGHKELADFSNFGKNTVDVAAPGVGILSTSVNQESMFMSGTSQAAPYVANVAARIKDINPKLNALQIKKIIMETVDKKSWLVGKVKSEGVVNLNRALKAAEYSTFNYVETAVALARGNVPDVQVQKSFPQPPRAALGFKLNFQPQIKLFK